MDRTQSHQAPRSRGGRSATRRGVASVLSMMFLMIFGSLAAAMAVVAQGNLRTADSSLKVSRAMSAAETGLTFGARRLFSESRRFVVEKGVIDADFADDLWSGTIDSGDYDLLPPDGYEQLGVPPAGIMEAVRDAHLVDDHAVIIEAGDDSLPAIDVANDILRVRPIRLGDSESDPYFRLSYALLLDEPVVRITSEGVDGDIRRTISMDFRIDKKIEYAILSPNRIMIGKNVHVEGPLGSLFGADEPLDLETENGDPLVVRSDFYYLDPALDAVLDTLYQQVVDFDVDGDARLRPQHPSESDAFTDHPELVDYDGDEYVDDFDLFLEFYDGNNDFMVVYDEDLAVAAGFAGATNEFNGIDDQLARLIDESLPDRDGDGAITAADTSLGYRDGVLDVYDLYAKVHGRLAFGVTRAAWEAEHGESYQTVVEGPIRADIDEAPVAFDVPEDELLPITTDMFDDSQSWFAARSTPTATHGADINVAPLDPVLLAGEAIVGGTYTAPADNVYESVPFGSFGAYDYYQRPVYANMTFMDVRIPRGNNGLFVNCTFVGVTYVESYENCADTEGSWNFAGALEPDGGGGYEVRFEIPTAEEIATGEIIADTRLVSNNLRFHDCTFLGSLAGDRILEYTHWRNKIQMTGGSRFFIDPDDPDAIAQLDADQMAFLEGITDEDRIEMMKSSILMPGWSVDVGNFTNEVDEDDPELTPTVNLQGTIIAGILDVRGTANVHGTLLMTYKPVEDAGPLSYGGQPDAFNTTIGYFGPDDGDDEGVDPTSGEFEGFGEIRLRYDPNALLPDGIPWPITIEPVPFSYLEGGG